MANPPASAGPGKEWPDQIADRVESVVGTVRDKTTKPITTAARATVYGLVAAIVGVVALFLLVLAIIRILDVYLPFQPMGRRVWIVDAAVAAIFLVGGAFLWRMRRPKHG
jgi:hypothetical protein